MGFRELTIGVGTSQIPPKKCVKIIEKALEIGYRHIDTAQYYENESAVGKGIARSSVEREDIFIATKVRPSNLGKDDVKRSVERSLERLGVSKVDLLYVHGPSGAYDPDTTIQAFNDLRDRGVFDHFGVSNFSSAQIRKAATVSNSPIYTNQIEMHPLYKPDKMLKFAHDHDIYIVAYSPFGRGIVFNDNKLVEIASRYDTSVAKISLAWILSKQNVVPIPKASSINHLRDNYEAINFDLLPRDVARIDSIDRTNKMIDPFSSDNFSEDM